MSFATKIFNINFTIQSEIFRSGEKIEGQMVHVAEGSSVKSSSQQSWSSGPYVKGGSHSQQQDK